MEITEQTSRKLSAFGVARVSGMDLCFDEELSPTHVNGSITISREPWSRHQQRSSGGKFQYLIFIRLRQVEDGSSGYIEDIVRRSSKLKEIAALSSESFVVKFEMENETWDWKKIVWRVRFHQQNARVHHAHDLSRRWSKFISYYTALWSHLRIPEFAHQKTPNKEIPSQIFFTDDGLHPSSKNITVLSCLKLPLIHVGNMLMQIPFITTFNFSISHSHGAKRGDSLHLPFFSSPSMRRLRCK